MLIFFSLSLLLIAMNSSFTHSLRLGILNNRISLLKYYTINRDSKVYNNKEDKEYGQEYYMGMITNTDTEESDKKDNLTPNLKLGGIFIGILFGLIGVFIYANKDIPPPQF
jgi:hypothetical protein